MRPDVADRRALAALFRLEAPGEVRGLQQPVLQVGAVHEVRLAELAVPNHLARLLDEGIAAVIERHGMDDARLPRGVDKRAGIFRIQRERLVRNDVLSMRQRRHDDGNVQVVGRRVVHDVHVGIGSQRLVAAVRLWDAQRVGLRAGRAIGARRHRDDIDEPETPHRIDVVRPDKSRADEAHPDPAHGATRAPPACTRGPSSLRRRACRRPCTRTRGRPTIGHLFCFSSCSTSFIGASPSPHATFGP